MTELESELSSFLHDVRVSFKDPIKIFFCKILSHKTKSSFVLRFGNLV